MIIYEHNNEPDLLDPDYIDSDEDTGEEANDPNSSIWDGSEVQPNFYGIDTTLPDPNEITQD